MSMGDPTQLTNKPWHMLSDKERDAQHQFNYTPLALEFWICLTFATDRGLRFPTTFRCQKSVALMPGVINRRHDGQHST